jgi:hypothetical protein
MEGFVNLLKDTTKEEDPALNSLSPSLLPGPGWS